MNYLRKLGFTALLLGFISIGFVVTTSAQSYGRWYGDDRYSDRNYRRDRRSRYSRWRDDDDDDRRRYRRYRYRNSGYVYGYPSYGYSNGYYISEKQRRKAWKRYQKAQRRAYRNSYYRNSWYRY